ncbi:MAG TPA: phage tail sheath subtilisin-like domain-containing protein [Pyrinomonadaceae bacterium]|nr:phage tail sheath subtilisin-like domain-containing protein [Pyrinomonadaceae bacterium]
MPEYLAPGVYVEETSFRSKSIEGVSTTTTGFVGPCRYGPIDLEPDIVTSLTEFERLYGDRQGLVFSGPSSQSNFLWQGVRAFFEEGGKRLYIARVFRKLGNTPDPYLRPGANINDDKLELLSTNYIDGHARAWLTPDPGLGSRDSSILIRARFPGALGNWRVTFTVVLGQNMLSGAKGSLGSGALRERDTVWIGDVSSPPSSPPSGTVGAGNFYIAQYDADEQTWIFNGGGAKTSTDFRLNVPNGSTLPALDPVEGHELRIISLTVAVNSIDGGTLPMIWSGLAPDPQHRNSFNSPDAMTSLFVQNPNSLSQARSLPIVILAGTSMDSGPEVIQALIDYGTASTTNPDLGQRIIDFSSLDSKTAEKSSDSARSISLNLTGGNDGAIPSESDYEGTTNVQTNDKSGLVAFEDIDDISIVAAPGATFGYNKSKSNSVRADSIIGALISHASRMRYRIAVLDAGDDLSISEVREMRAKLDSTYAALYYPWIRILDPVTNTEQNMPPSGFVAGIYARNDTNRAVYKAPANEVVNGAIGFEKLLNKAQQEVLNPEGINCFRFFEGRGFRLWGARTISSDPEWKYVNLRRYFAYLEHSIDKGTQWAVFEPNGEMLWGNVRRTIEDFLLNEW